VAAAAARILLASTRPLWYDELFTLWIAARPISEILSALSVDSGPPFFYLLEKPLARSGALALRLLPLASSVAIFAGAATLPSGAPRRRFLLLAAAFPLLTLYAAEARAYAPLALAGFAAFLFGTRGQESPARLLAAAAAAAAACWLHYLGVLAAGAILLATLWQRRWKSGLAIGAGAASFLPWTPTLLRQPPESTAWMAEPPTASLASFLSALGGAGRIPSSFGPPLSPAIVALGIAAGIAAVAGLAVAARRDGEIAASGLVSLGVLGGALACGLWRPIAFPGRTEMAVLPIFLWGLAKAAEAGAVARWAARAASAIGAIATLILLFESRPEPAYAAAPRELAPALPANSLLVAGGAFYLPARIEKDEGRLAGTLRGLPAGLESHPGWFPAAPPGRDTVAQLEGALAGASPGGSVYLLLPPLLADGPVSASLAARGAVEVLHRDAETVLIRYTRRD
jgi:hypothetical protein